MKIFPILVLNHSHLDEISLYVHSTLIPILKNRSRFIMNKPMKSRVIRGSQLATVVSSFPTRIVAAVEVHLSGIVEARCKKTTNMERAVRRRKQLLSS